MNNRVAEKNLRPRSRVLVGFHRLGVFLATPLLAGAIVLATWQWLYPSGPLKTDLPKNTLGYGFGQDDLDAAAQQILDEQRKEGYDVPSNLMLVGLPLGAVRFKGHDWMKFQLADGREIGVSTTMDATHADDIVRKFLLTEKKVGHPFDPSDEPFNIDGVKVTYLENEDWQPVTPPWLHKQREWMWPLVALCLAAAAYLVMRSLGWVIDGFVRKPL